jgi:hypothetical protein
VIYIKTYEKYSLSDSVDELSREISEFVYDEFRKWFGRGGLANYSNIHEYFPKSYSEDFPVEKFKINTIFVVSDKYGGLNRIGYFHPFDDEFDPSIMLPNGKLKICITLQINVSNKKRSIYPNEVRDMISLISTHEITHAYQYYKHIRRGKSPSVFEISSPLLEMSKIYFDFDNLYDFFNISYICSSKFEMDAFLSQSNINSGDNWVNGLKIFNLPFTNLLNLLKKDLSDVEEDINDVYETFIELYEDNLGINNFDELIKYLYNMVQRNKKYLIRKSNKIKYQSFR